MIATDWQAELRGVTIGAGTAYPFTAAIGGLGLPAPRSSDQERGNSPGNVSGHDIDSRRVLTIPVGLNAANPGAAWALFETLKVAWASSTVDLPFDLRLPGYGDVSRRYYGRPRGLDSNLALLRAGWVDVLATFDALDPRAYSVPAEVTLPGGATTLTNPGTAPTDRYTVDIDVGGAPVTFTNTADDEPALTLTDVTGTVILDGRDRTIVDGDGLDLYAHLAAGSGWPILAPGANPLTLTGGTGTITYRAAYL